jgi:branched-chain amino acid transport system ATP-binding protein
MLTLDGVFAGYGGGDVLKGVDLTITEGSITCVVGPNGAGKSTLLKVVSGLIHPRTGTVAFREQDLTRATPRTVILTGVVQVIQARGIFPQMTVRENVEIGAFLVRDRAIVRRRLAEVTEQFPIVRDRAHERAGALSGGQQRTVEFARALMLDPALVVLDEPSAGLDPKAARAMYDNVRRINAVGRTVLLVEQNVRAGLEAATHGVVMESGRIRLTGTGAEVLAHPEMSALYLGGAPQAAETPVPGTVSGLDGRGRGSAATTGSPPAQ